MSGNQISDKPIYVEVFGKKFGFREATAEEMDDLANKSLVYDTTGIVRVNLKIKNQFYMGLVVDVPDEDKELFRANKKEYLNKLKPNIRSKLLSIIKGYHEGLSDVEKK